MQWQVQVLALCLTLVAGASRTLAGAQTRELVAPWEMCRAAPATPLQIFLPWDDFLGLVRLGFSSLVPMCSALYPYQMWGDVRPCMMGPCVLCAVLHDSCTATLRSYPPTWQDAASTRR